MHTAPPGILPTMDTDLDRDPALAIRLCRESHARILRTVIGLTDADTRRPSRLPGWTVGHVLTHLARNAEGHTRRLEGALRGDEVPRYPGGASQREADIQAGARRPAQEIIADVRQAQERLEETMTRSDEAGWPNSHLLAGDHYPTTGSTTARLREAEMHHVDLGLGYEPADWPHEYVEWELRRLLEGVPGRLRGAEDRRALTAWLAGRRPLPAGLELDPW